MRILVEETTRARGIQVALLVLCATTVNGCPSHAAGPSGPAPSVPHLLCEAFEADQRPYVDRLQSVVADGSHALDLLGRCWPTARGAWALSVDEKLRARPGQELRFGKWSLVHIDPSGARSAVGPSLGFDASHNLDVGGTTLDPPAFFDFDGDGEVEIFLRVGWSPGDAELAAAGRIWTFHVGKGIERYAPARDLDVEALRDVDGDGRPDVITYSPYVSPNASKNSCGIRSFRLHGPPWVAHALSDGTFSRDDSVARAEAHRVCPAMPRPIVVSVDDVLDVQQTTRNIACARFMGAAPGDVTSALASRCGAPTCKGSACKDIELWMLLASHDPPPG